MASKDVNLQNFGDVISNSADDVTHARVVAALDDRNSDLSIFLKGLRRNDSLLQMALGAKRRKQRLKTFRTLKLVRGDDDAE